MAVYISSNNNRLYAAAENAFGTVPTVTGSQRIPAVSLSARSETLRPQRRDKTGTRSIGVSPVALRKETSYVLKTYHSSWSADAGAPSFGVLVEAAVGSPARLFAGATVDSTPGTNIIRVTAPHGLLVGQAVCRSGELRFVEAIVDSQTVQVNAPFSTAPGSGELLGPSATYLASQDLPSVSIFDYWSPDSAMQRVICGAAVDRMKVSINGDYHELEFRGPACDILDNSSFSSGQGALTAFPIEPQISSFVSQPVPGHLGQAWLGALPQQFFTITDATVTIANNIDQRDREFGSILPRSFTPGHREVSVSLSLYGQDSNSMRELYQAARQRSPIQVMFQLGQQAGQLMGILMKSVIVDPPEFDDSDTRLIWKFTNSAAYGLNEDEIVVAFG